MEEYKIEHVFKEVFIYLGIILATACFLGFHRLGQDFDLGTF